MAFPLCCFSLSVFWTFPTSDATAVRVYQHKQFGWEYEENNTAKKNPDQYKIFLDENQRTSLFLSLFPFILSAVFLIDFSGCFSAFPLFHPRHFKQQENFPKMAMEVSRDTNVYFPCFFLLRFSHNESFFSVELYWTFHRRNCHLTAIVGNFHKMFSLSFNRIKFVTLNSQNRKDSKIFCVIKINKLSIFRMNDEIYLFTSTSSSHKFNTNLDTNEHRFLVYVPKDEMESRDSSKKHQKFRDNISTLKVSFSA